MEKYLGINPSLPLPLQGKGMNFDRREKERDGFKRVYILTLILSLLSSLIFAQTPDSTQTQYAQVFEIPTTATDFTLDKLGNVYLITPENDLVKYNKKGELLFRYSDNTLGKLGSVDASNPMQILLYYPDFLIVKTLDRTLNPTGEVTLTDFINTQNAIICSSNDNNIWVFDMDNQQLKKIDRTGKVVFESADLRTIFLEERFKDKFKDDFPTFEEPLAPNFMIRDGTFDLIINDPTVGIFHFSIIGNYCLFMLPIKELNYFQSSYWEKSKGTMSKYGLFYVKDNLYVMDKLSYKLYESTALKKTITIYQSKHKEVHKILKCNSRSLDIIYEISDGALRAFKSKKKEKKITEKLPILDTLKTMVREGKFKKGLKYCLDVQKEPYNYLFTNPMLDYLHASHALTAMDTITYPKVDINRRWTYHTYAAIIEAEYEILTIRDTIAQEDKAIYRKLRPTSVSSFREVHHQKAFEKVSPQKIKYISEFLKEKGWYGGKITEKWTKRLYASLIYYQTLEHHIEPFIPVVRNFVYIPTLEKMGF